VARPASTLDLPLHAYLGGLAQRRLVGHGQERSKQSGPRVILEQLSISNVAPQGVHRLVAGHVHHLEYRCALKQPLPPVSRY
jgi:UDP-2,3-diacylglucosamine pyrophosphatase LpxH